MNEMNEMNDEGQDTIVLGQQLIQKWGVHFAPYMSDYFKVSMAMVLENVSKDEFDKTQVDMIAEIYPKLFAHKIINIQSMGSPASLIFYLQANTDVKSGEFPVTKEEKIQDLKAVLGNIATKDLPEINYTVERFAVCASATTLPDNLLTAGDYIRYFDRILVDKIVEKAGAKREHFGFNNAALCNEIIRFTNRQFLRNPTNRFNWILCSSEMKKKLEDIKNDFTIYELDYLENKIVLGHKGQSFMSPGLFYAPYIMLQKIDKKILTRSAMGFSPNGEQVYAVIEVI